MCTAIALPRKTGQHGDSIPNLPKHPVNASPHQFSMDGGCDCRAIRYRLTTRPLFVHCCHCRWCQRESGSAFALNAVYESDRVALLSGEPEMVLTPSASGYGQTIARCPHCKLALWSHYAGAGPLMKMVRVGTLDQPDLLPPDIHIFTSTKQAWVTLAPAVPAVAEYYEREDFWPPESLERRRALEPQIEAYLAGRKKMAKGSRTDLAGLLEETPRGLLRAPGWEEPGDAGVG